LSRTDNEQGELHRLVNRVQLEMARPHGTLCSWARRGGMDPECWRQSIAAFNLPTKTQGDVENALSRLLNALPASLRTKCIWLWNEITTYDLSGIPDSPFQSEDRTVAQSGCVIQLKTDASGRPGLPLSVQDGVNEWACETLQRVTWPDINHAAEQKEDNPGVEYQPGLRVACQTVRANVEAPEVVVAPRRGAS